MVSFLTHTVAVVGIASCRLDHSRVARTITNEAANYSYVWGYRAVLVHHIKLLIKVQ